MVLVHIDMVLLKEEKGHASLTFFYRHVKYCDK